MVHETFNFSECPSQYCCEQIVGSTREVMESRGGVVKGVEVEVV